MTQALYIGLMSGTSLDGVDAVLCAFSEDHPCQVLDSTFVPFDDAIRAQLIKLHQPDFNELETTALVGNQLASIYANAVNQLIDQSGVAPQAIKAVGCHGQTIRHRPELGYTIQIGNAALLAELTQLTVVADFRSRDIAAHGQGAPLVPAFHQAVFADPKINRVVLNIGGIANISSLHPHQMVTGFDSGPGNMLLDAWIEKNLGLRYDKDGAWASSGKIIPRLFEQMMNEAYLSKKPPKSTGRDLFNLAWLESKRLPEDAPQDVQRTLLEFTAETIVSAIKNEAPDTQEVLVCGGGAYNTALIHRIQQGLQSAQIIQTNQLGIPAECVEGAAFAWLAKQTLNQSPGNLPQVTGAKGYRILGAIFASSFLN
jgi:anhydro-N-acetylmuramic acid kinase